MRRADSHKEIKGEEKDRYIQNIIKSLDLLSERVEQSGDAALLRNLFSFYYFDSRYKSNLYTSLKVNMFSGFPDQSGVNVLLKDKTQNIHISHGEDEIISRVKKALLGEGSLQSIVENHGFAHYLAKVNSLPIPQMKSASFKGEELKLFLDSNKYFIRYSITFGREVEEQKLSSFINSPYRPDGGKDLYRWLTAQGLKPTSLVREQIGPFLSYMNSNNILADFRPFVPSLKSDKGSYVLYFSKEMMETVEFEEEQEEKRFIFFKKKKTVVNDRCESKKDEVYICNPEMFKQVKQLLDRKDYVHIIC